MVNAIDIEEKLLTFDPEFDPERAREVSPHIPRPLGV
jgi:hypothetical protein